MSIKRRLFTIGLMLATLFVAGTCGFVLLEGWSVMDGAYMTIITLSTVGYSETNDLTHVGRVFTGILILVSMFGMAFCTAGITSLMVSGDLTGAFRKRKEAKMIARFSGHTIVCGDGMICRTLIDQLISEGVSTVLVTDSKIEMEFMRQKYDSRVPIVESDPTNEAGLFDANILKAGVIIAAVDSDVSNLMITITARSIGPSIRIYGCAQSGEYASRMLKVGADEVICPLELGGKKLASFVTGHESLTQKNSASRVGSAGSTPVPDRRSPEMDSNTTEGKGHDSLKSLLKI